MDDYLKSGGVQSNLEILSRSPSKTITSKPRSKEDLFLQGYGRQWGDKITYTVGIAYGTGLLCGGSYGFAYGIKQGGATPKLFLNRVLNSTTTYGPGLANQLAVISLFYSGFSNLAQLVRGTDDEYNAMASGFLSGGLYKIATSWKSAAKYSVVASAVFTALDFSIRRGYL